MPNELRQPFAFFPCCSKPWIWVAKPMESRIKELIGRRSASACALSVERPAKYELRRPILFSSHSSEPMVDQGRFSDSAPGNNCHNIDLLVCPCIVQETDVLFTTKNITSCNGQSGYGNLFWTKSCRPLASFETRSTRGCLPQFLMRDAVARVDSICYRRYRLEQLVRSLESLCRIFLKEFLKENYDRLWNIFEPRKW